MFEFNRRDLSIQNKERNSSFELLRIFCIFGIVFMHSLSHVWLDRRFIFLSVAENSLFNIGVTVFILISGYFGVTLSVKKILYIEALAIFGGILNLLMTFIRGEEFGFFFIIYNIFPIVSRQYWFLTCYVCLILLSPLLNHLVVSLPQKHLLYLNLLLIILFYVCPTFFYYEITPDSGKGLLNMITVYFLGRYLKLYPINRKRRFWMFLGIVFYGVTFLANFAFLIFTSRVELPYTRDNSFFVLGLAVSVFLLFEKESYISNPINKAAKYVLPVYVYNHLVLKYFLPQNTAERLLSVNIPKGAFYIVLNVLLAILICVVIEFLRSLIFSPIEKRLFPWLERRITDVVKRAAEFCCEKLNIE